MLLPAQIVRSDGRIIYRIMGYNEWLKDFFSLSGSIFAGWHMPGVGRGSVGHLKRILTFWGTRWVDARGRAYIGTRATLKKATLREAMRADAHVTLKSPILNFASDLCVQFSCCLNTHY